MNDGLRQVVLTHPSVRSTGHRVNTEEETILSFAEAKKASLRR